MKGDLDERRGRLSLPSRPMDSWFEALLRLLALPELGLGALFVAAFLSATLVPVGSEPALFGLLKLQPQLFWPAVLVATAGNTLGGMVDWWLGYGAQRIAGRHGGSRTQRTALPWLERLGPKACLLAWLPIVGDPLCAVAGWLRLPFWPCALYMLAGKFLRYLVTTSALFWLFPQ